jgi:hypothetical protein
MGSRWILASLGIAAAMAALAGCGGGSTMTTRVTFQANAGTPATPILQLDGLTVLGSCRRAGHNPTPFLTVSARTAVDDAVIGSHFGQQAQASPDYTFVIEDFDRSFGRWDVLGTNPDKTAGTLNYSRPDGGQVSVTFVADEGAPQGDCVFGGTAISTP